MTRESSGRSTWRWQVPGISESEEDIPLEDLASPRIVLKRDKTFLMVQPKFAKQ